MRKIVLVLGIAALVIAPAVAKTKAEKAKEAAQAAEAADIAQQHANTLRVLRDGLPLILPSWLLPVYFNMHKDEKKDVQPAPGKKSVKAHKSAKAEPPKQ
jgi:hypothetical protein